MHRWMVSALTFNTSVGPGLKMPIHTHFVSADDFDPKSRSD